MALLRYLLRRLVTMALTLLVISALVFFIIKLPPGDYPDQPDRGACAPRARPSAAPRPSS